MRIFCPAMWLRYPSVLDPGRAAAICSRVTHETGQVQPRIIVLSKPARVVRGSRPSALSSGRESPDHPVLSVAVGCCRLLDDADDPAGAHRAAAFPDREPQALFHGDRLDQLDAHLGVVTGGHHNGALKAN